MEVNKIAIAMGIEKCLLLPKQDTIKCPNEERLREFYFHPEKKHKEIVSHLGICLQCAGFLINMDPTVILSIRQAYAMTAGDFPLGKFFLLDCESSPHIFPDNEAIYLAFYKNDEGLLFLQFQGLEPSRLRQNISRIQIKDRFFYPQDIDDTAGFIKLGKEKDYTLEDLKNMKVEWICPKKNRKK